MDAANAALAKADSGVMGVFSFSEPPALAAGRFGPWSLEPGGSGNQVQVAIPIVQGVLQGVPGQPTFALDGVVIHLTVALVLKPSMLNAHDLLFGFKRGTPPLKSGGNPDVSLVRVEDPSGKVSSESINAIGMLVVDGLNAQADDVDYAFARIGAAVAQAMNWPPLAWVAFNYQEAPARTGHLAILGMATGDAGPTDPNTPKELLGLAPLVMAMSGDLALQRLVQPMLPEIVGHNTSDANFGFDADAHALVLKDVKLPPILHELTAPGHVDLDSVKPALITYYPIADHLSVSLDGANLAISASGSCDLYAGFSMTWSMDVRDGLVFDKASSSASFRRVGDPTVGYQTPSEPDPVQVGGPGGWLQAWLVEQMIGGIEDAVADSVRRGLVANLGGMHLDQTPSIPIQWSGAGGLALSGATLDDALVVTLDRSGG
jgi:hypothetical protein